MRSPSLANNKQNPGNSAQTISVARLRRDQGKRQQARELLALIH
jgi:hypothetical protein